MTSNPFQSEPHVCLDWHDPFKQDPVLKSTLHHLPELNESSKCIQSSDVSSVTLSEIAAAREGATCEDPIIKMIEVKQVSDGLKVSYTGDTLTLERAFQCGLLPASVYVEILQRQKTRQDAAEDVSLLESIQEIEPCEVNRLILKCLSRNKSLTSGRDIHTLKSFYDGDQEAMLRLLGAQLDVGDPDEGQYINEVSEDVMSSIANVLKVDAAIQCDLMSSSSTLTVLGDQQQFMGLVLHPSGEIQTVSTSFQDNQQITTNEFTSRLFSDREKIAAFYIPEYSEVVDVTAAIQKGLIDNYTAEVLKSIEIPDVFPDVDHLNEKFSSWLMYKKLTVDGCYHAADCLKVDNVPSHTEAKQLLISYLMLNSYIDPKTEKRVLILDRQLSKMVKIFLEDSMLSENSEKNVTSLILNVGDVSERVDLEILLHINEETEELMRYTQQTCDPHNFVSSVNGTITFNEKTQANEKAVNHHPVMEVFGDNDIDMDTTDPDVAEKTMCQKNTNWTKSGEFVERIYGNSLKTDVGGADRDVLDIPTVPVASGCLSEMFDSERSVKSCHQTLPYYDPDSLCSKSEGTDVFEAEFLCSEDLEEGDNEQDYVIQLLKAQMEEGGILDVPSGRWSDLEAALSKGLVDERTVLKLLDSHSDDKESAEGDEEGAMSVLKQATSDGFKSSNLALSLMEQQSHSRSGCTISISESLQSALVKDDVDRILNSDPKASIYPKEDYNLSISDDHNLGLININGAENTQQQTERKVTVMGLDLTDEEVDRRERESENRDAEVDCETTGNAEEMSSYLHHYQHSVGGHESVMTSLSLWSQVTAECVHHTDKSSLLAEGSDSQGVINDQLTDSADVFSFGIENTAPTTQPRPSNDRANPESHTLYATCTSHTKSDSSPFVDEFFMAGHVAEVGNQAVCETELDTSSSHRNVLSEKNTVKSDTSAVQSPLHSEPTPSRDYSSARVENAIISVSRGNGSYDNNITEDGNRVTSPLQTALHSESDFSVEPGPGLSMLVGERFPQSHVASDEVTATDSIGLKCFDGGDSEHCTQTTTRVSLEAVLVDEDLSGSQRSAIDDAELGTGHLSPERQHGGFFKITVDVEHMSVSRHAETSDEQNADIDGKVSALEMSVEQSETIMGVGLGASEDPQVVSCQTNLSDFLSDSFITSDFSSSAPSVFSDAVRTCFNHQREITEVINVSDLQKAQDVESTISIVPNPPQPLEKGSYHERDTPHGLVESSHPDPLMDLLKQNALASNNKGGGDSELTPQEDKVSEKTEQSDSPNIQLQLLQVLQTVSSSQDLSMLQEVMETLNTALGGDSPEEQRHILESIKEESSEGEDEGSAEDDLCHSAEGTPESSANSDACKVEQVKNKVHFTLFQC